MKRLVSAVNGLAVASTAVIVCAGDAHASEPTVELRAQWDEREASPRGPLADARQADPSLAAPTPRMAWLQANLKHTLALPATSSVKWRLGVDLLARHEWLAGAARHDASRINEAWLAADAGALAFSAGKKVLGWDVGYAFRPNDVVQQEDRRSIAGTPLEGRPLLQAEWFGSDDAALALVWVNPQAWGRSIAQAPGGGEGAFALRGYKRFGTLDWHGFARRGDRTGASVGTAASWVPGEATEWHASLRWLARHEGWQMDSVAPGQLATNNPWSLAAQGRSVQALVGMNWTGHQQQTVLVEAWYDGTAPGNATWRRWSERNAALRGLAVPPALMPALTGNLAWQASPLVAPTLRRENLLARVSWQPTDWQLWADVLWQPTDGGRSVSAGVQWQGAMWRLNASVRGYGGPASAVLAQLPSRRQWLLAATLVL